MMFVIVSLALFHMTALLGGVSVHELDFRDWTALAAGFTVEVFVILFVYAVLHIFGYQAW